MNLVYCTTCYNRFWQLKQVIKHNLNIINKTTNVTWIIVDFGGSDSEEMQTWIKANCPKSLARGSLKYFCRSAPDFVWNVSIAKNVAHRLAIGTNTDDTIRASADALDTILVNLDGDNFLQPNDPDIVRQIFAKQPNTILHQTWNNYLVKRNVASYGKAIKYASFQNKYTGSNGRISLTASNFIKLGGYDEEMLFMGFQDTDLLTRAVLSDLHYQSSAPQQKSISLVSSQSRTGPSRLMPRKATSACEGTRPRKGSDSDAVDNQRAVPYANNVVKSWSEAEQRNRILSNDKIGRGQLIVNEQGFAENLENYREMRQENVSESARAL